MRKTLMLNLEQECFLKISTTELENLVFDVFGEKLDILMENSFLKEGNYTIINTVSKTSELVTKSLIDELLFSPKYKYVRINQIIWLLTMENILPETKLRYLIQIIY